jgi:hypothetical protein
MNLYGKAGGGASSRVIATANPEQAENRSLDGLPIGHNAQRRASAIWSLGGAGLFPE